MPNSLIDKNCSRPVKSMARFGTALMGLTASMVWTGPGYALTPDLEDTMKQLNQQFSAGVIIPGYQALDNQMAVLVSAAQSFEADPTDANLAAVRSAWLEAVAQWTSSNAVAFGPVHSLGYSTALESPVDEMGLDMLLSSASETEEFAGVASLLPSLQGFEAIAYLLGTGAEKTAADFSIQERRYLKALTARAQVVTTEMLTVWQTGWNDHPAYSTLLSTAGNPDNSTYMSVKAGSEEIIRSIINSLDVVAGEALPDILDTSDAIAKTPDMVTLKLLDSSVQGIQSAYLGAVDDSTAETVTGVSELVAIADPTLDQQIQTSLTTALNGLEQAMTDPTNVAPLVQAQSSLDLAFELLETEVLPLVQN